MVLRPNYGRDYKSASAVRKDWNANKDFIILSVMHGAGRTISKSCAPAGLYEIRYNKLQKVTVVNHGN